MIKIKLEYSDYVSLVVSNRRRRLPIGHQVEFTLPDGSMLSCVTVQGPFGTCGACPFALYDTCPTWSESGRQSVYPYSGYMVKDGSLLERL